MLTPLQPSMRLKERYGKAEMIEQVTCTMAWSENKSTWQIITVKN